LRHPTGSWVMEASPTRPSKCPSPRFSRSKAPGSPRTRVRCFRRYPPRPLLTQPRPFTGIADTVHPREAAITGLHGADEVENAFLVASIDHCRSSRYCWRASRRTRDSGEGERVSSGPQFRPSASRNWIGSREEGAGAARVCAIPRPRADADTSIPGVDCSSTPHSSTCVR